LHKLYGKYKRITSLNEINKRGVVDIGQEDDDRPLGEVLDDEKHEDAGGEHAPLKKVIFPFY
jgi:hypothetical protein